MMKGRRRLPDNRATVPKPLGERTIKHLSFRENGCIEPRAGAIIYLSTLDSLVGVLRWVAFGILAIAVAGILFFLPSVGRYKVSVVLIHPLFQIPLHAPSVGL